jgi:serine/threonine protein kinase
MQYIPKRSVYEIIPKPGKKPNLQLIASVMKDLISAVYYLHNMKPIIIHRDIKPENVLLDENSRAYLTDFGWSNYVQSFKRRTTVCGTPLYLPPEMVNETSHDEKADIWCIGVLLFELSTGRVPFEGRDLETVKANILRLNITWPREIDPEVKDLISQILRLNPKSRLSIEEILSHSFFTKYFPNAVNELIKPDHQQNKIFIVSQDDPKTWGEIKKKPTISTSSSSGGGNTNFNINANTNASTHINSNTNYNNNISANNFTKINVRNNNTRTNANSNVNVPRNFHRTKTVLVPKTEIDLTSHERENNHNRRSSGRGITKVVHSHNNSLNKSNRNSNAHKSFNTNNIRYSVKYNLRDNHSKNIPTTNNYSNSFRNSNNTFSSNTTNYTNNSNNRGSFINNNVGYSNINYSSNTLSKGNAGTIKKTSTYSNNTFSKVNRMSYRNSNSKKNTNNNNSNVTDRNRMSFKHNNHTNYNSNTINNNRSAYNPFLSNQYIQ